MARKDLIPLTKRSPEEARELRIKGAHASNEARRRNRDLANTVKALMEMKVSNKNAEELKRMGFKEDETTNMALFAVSLLKNGINGNNKAIDKLVMFLEKDREKELRIEKLQNEIALLKQAQNNREIEDLSTLANALNITKDRKTSNNDEEEDSLNEENE